MNDIKVNDAFYDKASNRIFTIKAINEKDIIITGPVTFYDDAFTHVERYHICRSYLENCVPIVGDLEQYPFLCEDESIKFYRTIYLKGENRYSLDPPLKKNPNFTYDKELSDKEYTEYNRDMNRYNKEIRRERNDF